MKTRVHEGAEPFKCRYIEKTHNNHFDHELIILQIVVCDKTFKGPSHLKRHEYASHTNHRQILPFVLVLSNEFIINHINENLSVSFQIKLFYVSSFTHANKLKVHANDNIGIEKI